MKPGTQQVPCLAGTARCDITPQGPISMGGYGQRAGKLSEGVHDALYAKVLILKIDSTQLVLITTDLLCIPEVVYRKVVDGLVSTGLAKEEEICLSASHTHSGPEMKDNLMVANIADDYNKRLIDDILATCEKAAEALVPAEIKIATGRVDFLMNRRQRSQTGLVDERVLALQVQDLEQRRGLAVLFGVGCHAVALGHDNMLLSADFPGVAQKYIEDHLGVQNALFVNLTEGNVIPESRGSWDSLDTRGYLGGKFSDAERIGSALGNEVVRCLGEAAEIVSDPIRVGKRNFQVKPNGFGLSKFKAFGEMQKSRRIILEYVPEFRKANLFHLQPVYTLWRDASLKVIEQNMTEEEMRRLMSAVSTFIVMLSKLLIPKYSRPVQVSVQTIEIGEYHLMTLPGEVLVEVGRDWQTRNRPHGDKAFIIGLANGWMGYLPHPSNFQEPGAEFKYETIMNALEPEATRLALEKAEEMLKP